MLSGYKRLPNFAEHQDINITEVKP